MNTPVFSLLLAQAQPSVSVNSDNLGGDHLVVGVAVILFVVIAMAGYSHWKEGRKLEESRRRAAKMLGRARRKAYLNDVIQPRR